jgi:hypothetical protein
MQPFHEKIFFGLSSLLSTAMAAAGAIISDGDMRWLFITFTACIPASSMLALIFKRPCDSMGLVAGRSGFAILCGVLGTKYAVYKYDLHYVDSDAIALAGISSLICVIGFIVGFKIIKSMDASSNKIAAIIIKKVFGLVPEEEKDQ